MAQATMSKIEGDNWFAERDNDGTYSIYGRQEDDTYGLLTNGQALKEVLASVECGVCSHTSCPGHCGRCGREMAWHPGGKVSSCPRCTTRIGRR